MEKKTLIIGIVALVVIILIYFLILPNNSTIKPSSAKSIYSNSEKSIFYIQTNCVAQVRYPKALYQYIFDAGNAGVWVDIVPDSYNRIFAANNSADFTELTINFGGYATGFKSKDKIYTNAHVVDCSQETFDNYLKGGVGNATRFEEQTGLPIDAMTEQIWNYSKTNMKTTYEREDVSLLIAQEYMDYLKANAKVLSLTTKNVTAVQATKNETDLFLVEVEKRGEIWPGKDYALLKTNDERFWDIPNLKLGNSKKTDIGDSVYIIGFPGYIGPTVIDVSDKTKYNPTITGGIITSFKITKKDELYIQTDASSLPGNSGSPVFNSNGEVIGMLTAGIGESYNFVFPIDNIPKQ